MTAQISVLLVEDDDWFAEQQARTLSAAGCSVTRAANGLAAIELLDQAQPDVLVLDIFLPGSNGIALLHELQSYRDLAVLPVIVCTNSGGEMPEDTLSRYGVRRVIDKSSMEPGDIVAAVRRELA